MSSNKIRLFINIDVAKGVKQTGYVEIENVKMDLNRNWVGLQPAKIYFGLKFELGQCGPLNINNFNILLFYFL